MPDGLERLQHTWAKATVGEHTRFPKAMYRHNTGQTIEMRALVGYATAEPMVELRWDHKLLQWAPETAVPHALQVIECAEALLHVAFFVKFLEQRLGATREHGMHVLLELRAWRQRRAELPEDPVGRAVRRRGA
jgi:hypothetical protein